jgi:hypothetical protein
MIQELVAVNLIKIAGFKGNRMFQEEPANQIFLSIEPLSEGRKVSHI